MEENKKIKVIKEIELELTPRVCDLIRLCADGLTDKQIARDLNCSYGNLRRIWAGLYKDSGTKNRATLIAWAFRNGILQ